MRRHLIFVRGASSIYILTPGVRPVAAATTPETTTGIPTPVGLLTAARNNKVMLEALKAVAERPFR